MAQKKGLNCSECSLWLKGVVVVVIVLVDCSNQKVEKLNISQNECGKKISSVKRTLLLPFDDKVSVQD